jgi:hypothetical protein
MSLGFRWDDEDFHEKPSKDYSSLGFHWDDEGGAIQWDVYNLLYRKSRQKW